MVKKINVIPMEPHSETVKIPAAADILNLFQNNTEK